jgi:hypothetical protein
MNRITFSSPDHQAGLTKEPVSDLEPVRINEEPDYEKNVMKKKSLFFESLRPCNETPAVFADCSC